MRFLSNFAFTIMFMCSINFWHQQDCNSLFIGSIGHETSQWPINAKFLKTVCALLYFTRICRNTNFSTWYLKEQTAAFPVIVINTKNQSKNILNPILGWLLVIKNFFFSSNLVGRIFFSLLNALQDIFFPPHFSAGFFFLKKGSCVYIYKMYLHLHCGHCSNSSNMELQSLKML